MNQTPKIIEDAVEEFRKQLPEPERFHHINVDYKDHINLVDWLRKTLTHIHTQAKVEERERLLKDLIENWGSAADLVKFYEKETLSNTNK